MPEMPSFDPNAPIQPASETPPEPQGFRQRARGILGNIGGFFQSNPDLLDTLAIGFGGMSLNPNQALMQQSAARIQQRQELARIQGGGNRTAEYFRSVGRDDLAQAVESNPELAPAIYQEYIKAQFAQPEETYSVLSAEEAAAMGLPEGRAYKRNDLTNEVSAIGAAGTNMYFGDQRKEFGYEYLSAQYQPIQEAASNSQAVLDDVELITNLIGASDLSTMESLVASRYPEFSNLLRQGDGKIAASRAIINARAPQFRVSGSGATSDRDMAMYIQALPTFTATLEGNLLTVEIFRAKAEKDAERARVMNDWAAERISQTEALDALNKLNTESLFTPGFRRRVDNLYPEFFEQQASSQNASGGVTFEEL
jgi:hypothetical protein